MNLFKKCTAKPYYFLVIDATLASDNPSLFRKNLLEVIWKLMTIMTIDDKIRKKRWILTEEQQKYELYHQVKLTNMKIFMVTKCYPWIKEE